jgi:hypothetical protein
VKKTHFSNRPNFPFEGIQYAGHAEERRQSSKRRARRTRVRRRATRKATRFCVASSTFLIAHLI